MKKTHTDTIPNRPIPFILFSSKPYTKWMLLAFTFVILGSSTSTSLAFIFKKIIDTATTAAGNGLSDATTVMWWVIAYAAGETICALLYRGSGFTGARWITNSEAYRYGKLFDYMSSHSQSYFDNRFAGALVNKIADAARRSSDVIESILWNYLPTVIRLTVSLILIATTNLTIGLIFIGWALFLLPLNYFLARKRRVLSEKESELSSQLRGKSVDATANIAAVHQYARRPWEVQHLGNAIELHRVAALKSWFFGERMLTLNNILLGGFMMSMLLMTFFAWRSGSITLGSFVMVLTLVVNISDYFEFIGVSMNRFAKNYGEINNGLEEIMHPHEITDRQGAQRIVATQGAVVLTNVDFWYNERKPILSKFNLNVQPGERIGIVGQSGAGKTTLIRLLLRQHEVKGGRILIDGQDISTITLESLRESISIVPQEPLLFHRSIRENIAYGKLDATQEEIEEAAKQAQAHGFIDTLPDKYDTLVGERGVKLSAGQRQRIAIARAILKNAPILILDEATSALDSESEVLIQRALEELMKGKTVFAIAHRLSTLSEMTKLIVMKEGKIIEEGTHESLLKKKTGLYKKLWEHQAGGFLVEE